MLPETEPCAIYCDMLGFNRNSRNSLTSIVSDLDKFPYKTQFGFLSLISWNAKRCFFNYADFIVFLLFFPPQID